MSNANIKLMQDLYAAFGRRDMQFVLDGCTSDVTWGMTGRKQDLPLQGIHEGKPGVGEFFREMAEIVEIKSFEPRNFQAAEDKVFVWGHWSWTMHSSGVSGENDWLHIFTLRDGKVAQWRGYNDGAQLLAAYRAAPARRAVSA